jgi:hypothetical protein
MMHGLTNPKFSKIMYFCRCQVNGTVLAEPGDPRPVLSTSSVGYFPHYRLPLVLTVSLPEIHIDLICPSVWYRVFFFRFLPYVSIRFRYSGFDINAFLSLDQFSVVPSQEPHLLRLFSSQSKWLYRMRCPFSRSRIIKPSLYSRTWPRFYIVPLCLKMWFSNKII